MNQNPLLHKNSIIVLYCVSGVIAFFQLNIGIGIAFGLSASIVHQYFFVKYLDQMLFAEKFSVFGFIVGYVFRFAILALSLVGAIALPEFINIFGVIFGLFVLKLLLYVKELSLKKGENR